MSTREEDREEKEQKTEEEKLIGSKKRNKKKKKEAEEEEGEEEEEKEREKAEEEYKPEVERSKRVLLRGIFKVGKRSHDVLLTATHLTWSPILPESPAGEACISPPGELMLRDVLAVKVKRRRAVGQRSGGPVLGVALFYCKRRGRRLEEDTLHLHNASSEHTHTWYNSLKEVLAGLSGRPRRVKVFINPSSHKKEAVHVYREHVAPLFKMADVRTDITVTEKAGHALSVVKELKLDDFDGVVCVGGDGSVAEVCHALVLRAQLDAGSPDVPVGASLPLGIIPAGSTDAVSCSVHGVRDPVTAAMHVILGIVIAGALAVHSALLEVVWLRVLGSTGPGSEAALSVDRADRRTSHSGMAFSSSRGFAPAPQTMGSGRPDAAADACRDSRGDGGCGRTSGRCRGDRSPRFLSIGAGWPTFGLPGTPSLWESGRWPAVAVREENKAPMRWVIVDFSSRANLNIQNDPIVVGSKSVFSSAPKATHRASSKHPSSIRDAFPRRRSRARRRSVALAMHWGRVVPAAHVCGGTSPAENVAGGAPPSDLAVGFRGRPAPPTVCVVFSGHVQRVDMCSLRSPGGPPRFGFCAMFGFGGRSLARAEKKRWMPPARRRDYALLKTLARLRPEDCRLSFLTSRANDRDRDAHQDGDSEGAESWSSAEGLFLSVGVMAIPCLSPHAPRGLAPDTKLADGSATLIAVGATSRSEFVKHLKSYGAPGGQLDLSFVETRAVTAVKLRARGSSGRSEDGDASFPWNVDGELLQLPDEVLIGVHGRLIGLYGEEVDEAESPASCGCI